MIDNLLAKSPHVWIEFGGSFSNQVRAAPFKENGNNFSLITSYETWVILIGLSYVGEVPNMDVRVFIIEPVKGYTRDEVE